MGCQSRQKKEIFQLTLEKALGPVKKEMNMGWREMGDGDALKGWAREKESKREREKERQKERKKENKKERKRERG